MICNICNKNKNYNYNDTSAVSSRSDTQMKEPHLLMLLKKNSGKTEFHCFFMEKKTPSKLKPGLIIGIRALHYRKDNHY